MPHFQTFTKYTQGVFALFVEPARRTYPNVPPRCAHHEDHQEQRHVVPPPSHFPPPCSALEQQSQQSRVLSSPPPSSPPNSLFTHSPLTNIFNMGNKRTAAEASRPATPRAATKRQRAQSGLPRPITSPRPATPARPPRMPRFDHDQVTATADKKLVNRLNRLTAQELLILVKDVELRFRQLATFEKEEIRRAQKLGFTNSNSPLKVMMQTTAW